MEYHLHKISLNRGSSYIDSPIWIKNERVTINPQNAEYNTHIGEIKTKEIRQAYISEHNVKRNNQVDLLLITDGTSNWHYLAIKKISGLLRGITSNHNGDFYCLNCLHSYPTIHVCVLMQKIYIDLETIYTQIFD